MGNKLLKMNCLGYSKDLMDEPSQKTPSAHSTPFASLLCDKGSIAELKNHHYTSLQTHFATTLYSSPPNTIHTHSSRSSSPSCSCKSLTSSPNRKGIKVLFLNVNGVLNTTFTMCNEIEDRLLAFLKLIVERTDCKIVLSTAWRLHNAYKTMLLQQLQMRAAIDVSDIVIGDTPYIPNCYRVTEISMFIHRYNSNFNHKYYINNFAVLDDLPLDKYPHSLFLDGHFVHTDKAVGLSMLNVVDCIQILNSQQFVPYQKQLKSFNRAWSH